ncbi:MAG: hypothetical protein WAU37_01610 [Formosimonas sp.]|jgi:hypothetical protein
MNTKIAPKKKTKPAKQKKAPSAIGLQLAQALSKKSQPKPKELKSLKRSRF